MFWVLIKELVCVCVTCIVLTPVIVKKAIRWTKLSSSETMKLLHLTARGNSNIFCNFVWRK